MADRNLGDKGVCVLRAFSGFGAISRWAMGVFRILKRPNHLEMVGPLQDPENAQGHGMHSPATGKHLLERC